MSSRFTLRILIPVLLIPVCLCGWYAFRLRQVRQERAWLHGKWRRIDDNGVPIRFLNGKYHVLEFSEDQLQVNPFRKPKWLDFRIPRMGNKLSKCIYRREGERLRIVQASPGAQRPRSFEDSDPVPDKGCTVGETISVNKYWLERIPEQ